MKHKVGVIGGAGAMGSFMADVFFNHGYEISICDINEDAAKKLAEENNYKLETAKQLAESSDIVLWSLPIPETVSMIDIYAKFMKKGSLALDVTSVKVEPVQAMIRSTPKDVDIIGMHPMFRPTITMDGQKVVLTPVKEESEWLTTLEEILEKEGAEIKITTPREHDRAMAVIQGLTHTVHMVSLETIRSMDYDLSELSEYASPVYKLFFNLMGRITSGNPDLYAAIQMFNPEVIPVLQYLDANLTSHFKAISSKDIGRFAASYLAIQEFLGSFAEQANKSIETIIGKPKDIEIFFDREHADFIQKLVGRGEPADYKGWLKTMQVKDGDLAKLRTWFPLAKYTRYDHEVFKEGTVAFYVRNSRHPTSGKPIRLTPIVTFNPEKTAKIQPEWERVQMFNRYSDPILNLFNTWERYEELNRKIGPLVAYRTPRDKAA